MGKLHMNVGGVKNLFFIISQYLDALFMPMALITHEENLSQDPFDVYLLDMVKMLE
jgi:hypothetical protein